MGISVLRGALLIVAGALIATASIYMLFSINSTDNGGRPSGMEAVVMMWGIIGFVGGPLVCLGGIFLIFRDKL